MTIATLDAALAGMQPRQPFAKVATPTLVIGKPQSLWGLAGFPGAGTYTSSGTPNGANLVAPTAGQLPHVDPGAGNSYLARLAAMVSQPGVLILADRLWQNGIAATVTNQPITQPTLPARDNAASANGDGVLIGCEVAVATSTNAPTMTLTYTNQAGVVSHTSSNIDATAATASVGSFFRLGLQAGDTGVRSVTNFALSATWTAGTINLVAYRVLAQLEITAANIGNSIDALTAGFPRIPNGAVPFLIFIPTATTAATVCGEYVETQG